MSRSASPVVVRFGRLGDMVLLQPLLRQLHRRFGQPCTLVARGEWSTSLYAGHTDVARVLNVHDSHRPFVLSPRQWRVLFDLHRLRDAPVYVCEPEPRALAKVRRMLTLAGVRGGNCIYLSDMSMVTDEHWIDRLLRFGQHTPDAWRDADYEAHAPPLASAPVLQVSDSDRADCTAWLRANAWNTSPLVLLQPANKRTIRWHGVRGVDDDKWWPIERWAAVARAIRKAIPDSRILLCGALDEADFLRTIRDETDDARVHVIAEALPLRRLMALQELAHSMISVDTGPAHMAAALGCPLVVLFGRVSPQQWLPRGEDQSSVIAIGGPARGGRVDALGVDEVLTAWATLIGDRGPRIS